MPAHFALELRREICARNHEYARTHRLNHAPSYGAQPVIVYAPESCGTLHGNFYSPSFRAILRRPEWARRLGKIHAQARRSLPHADRRWRELDSCTSSDALLMNVFCCPGVCRSQMVAAMLGTETSDKPEFGYKARVPLKAGRFDRTEVDLMLGRLLVEAKLTEGDFQAQSAALVGRYRDLHEVFDVPALPSINDRLVSYQLIRSVLAAHATGASFCVMLDTRRPDLLEAWHLIMRCVRYADLRTRCKVLTWQELSGVLPPGLRKFLQEKYGIATD